MSWNTDGQTQAQQDASENGERGGIGFHRISAREPGCPLCKAPLIRKSLSVVRCCECKCEFTANELKSLKININEIG